ncbi:flowering-promoting factor 1-like protein 3 [Tanacetum coccineum]
MSGVWVFKNGVVRLVDGNDSYQGSAKRKVLVHVAANEVVTSYQTLERILSSLGWERYYEDPDLFQFHKRSTVHLISLPRDFNKLKPMHMYDIVVKNRNVFEGAFNDEVSPSLTTAFLSMFECMELKFDFSNLGFN